MQQANNPQSRVIFDRHLVPTENLRHHTENAFLSNERLDVEETNPERARKRAEKAFNWKKFFQRRYSMRDGRGKTDIISLFGSEKFLSEVGS